MVSIVSVTPYPTGTTVSNLIKPDIYVYHLRDLSAEGAGRTEDYVTDKKRVGQVVELELGWTHVSIANASAILTAYNSEYVTVVYLDAKAGTNLTKVFQVTDRAAPALADGFWDKVGFTIVERGIS